MSLRGFRLAYKCRSLPLWRLLLLFIGASAVLLYTLTALHPVTALDAVDLKTSTQDIRWCTDAIPADFIPWMGDTWIKRLVAEKGRAVIVVGTESSGSKLAALSIERMLHHDANSWRLSESTHEGKREYWDEIRWGGHGSIGQAYSQWVVVHRSLPHGGCMPRLSTMLSMLGPHGLGMSEDRVFLVVSTRDRTTTLRSKVLNHQHDSTVAPHEQQIAAGILADWVLHEQVKTYVFSYESFMLLGIAYLKPLAQFLQLDHTKVLHPALVDGSLETMPALQDANVKWHSSQSLWERAHQAFKHMFNHRPPAFGSGPPIEPPSKYITSGQVFTDMHRILKYDGQP